MYKPSSDLCNRNDSVPRSQLQNQTHLHHPICKTIRENLLSLLYTAQLYIIIPIVSLLRCRVSQAPRYRKLTAWLSILLHRHTSIQYKASWAGCSIIVVGKMSRARDEIRCSPLQRTRTPIFSPWDLGHIRALDLAWVWTSNEMEK